ncbi:MAG: ATP-dependent protease ATPase subunit HslU [bacterium]|nr:ATP-dependent protease ATPase subunit HslU [bacterium]
MESRFTGDESELTPRAIVRELDKFIVGQEEAKKVVAIALRNRMRRRRLDEALQEEVIPKNIIMIGPTGVGKTEIARRLARLVQAPFVKVEASKYTEVGYVGRDVESMVRDLVETAVAMVREEMFESIRPQAERRARERLLDLLQPGGGRRRFIGGFGEQAGAAVEGDDEADTVAARHTRDQLARLLDEGALEEREVEVEIAAKPGLEGMFGVVGIDDQMMSGLRDMMEKVLPQKTRRSRLTVGEARKLLIDQEAERLLDQEKVTRTALERAQQTGIIFIDEIDKIAGRQAAGAGPDVSREGVQRDILPIVEGSTVFTKHGTVRTDHILFIAAGAFHTTKPSDLIPELQGRFPLRVELSSLTTDDFKRILVEPENSLIKQYTALLATDGVELVFTGDAIDELAHSASRINQQAENIGARRLHSVLERVLEPVAFDAPDAIQGKVAIDRAYVLDRLKLVLENQDLSRFIL